MDHRPTNHQCDRRPSARYVECATTHTREANGADHGYESTFIDAPETPAHQFAVKAFKRAVFGTPAADDAANAAKKLQKKQSPDLATSRVPVITAPKDDTPPVSPSKLPGGILMTPGTANKGRKSVSFGAHVVDNEGKRGTSSRSGIPSDCPGKFPSPWAPGTELKASTDSEQKRRTKLTAALLDARTTTQPRGGQKPKARDDSDITMDLGAPRSDSGKYWKEQYEEYTARSEKEVKKLIAKQHLAKDYAKKKDGEVTELVTKLEQERKRFRRREQELEQQNKDYQERLRQAMAEQLSASLEITALKNRIATLEKSTAVPCEPQEAKSSSPFQIFEDSSKKTKALEAEQGRVMDASYLSQKVRVVSIGKENSPPKPNLVRRQTMPEPSSLAQESLSAMPRLGVTAGDVSTIVGRSPRTAAREADSAPKLAESALTSTLSTRKHGVNQLSLGPRSPPKVAPSSPLPQPSPDPWMMDADESSIAPYDRMSLPIGGGGGSYSRTSRSSLARRHGPSKSISHALATEQSRSSQSAEEADLTRFESEAHVAKASHCEKAGSTSESLQTVAKAREESLTNLPEGEDRQSVDSSPSDLKLDVIKGAVEQAEGSPRVKKERGPTLPSDRKEEARRRLAERKQRKLLGR